jgi:prephenate dehydratase
MSGRGMSRTLGALGGPHTFGGQAALAMIADRPELGAVAYLPSSPVLFGDSGEWAVDAACVPAHTSRAGAHLSTHRRLCARSELQVVAEIEHAYHCCLLVRPGSDPAGVREVLGHTGSLNQSRDWLAENLPDAVLHVVDSHSMGAALTVAESDGTVAAVGTEPLAAQVGLDVAARDIDGGAVGLYWALAPEPMPVTRAQRVIAVGETDAAGNVGWVVSALADSGFAAAAVHSEAVGDALLHQRVVVYGVGDGDPDRVAERLDSTGFRLAGAYPAPGASASAPAYETEGADRVG